MIPTENAWDLYYRIFNDGDDVYVITDSDEAFWGKAHATQTGLLLSRPNVVDRFLDWDDITFMSHDGFPVRKLMGADGSKAIEKTNTKSIEAGIRKILTASPKITEGEFSMPRDCPRHSQLPRDHPRHSQLVFGDPFMVENVQATLINTFYTGNHIWEPETEELIILRAPDGAVGLLYELNRIYHFETRE